VCLNNNKLINTRVAPHHSLGLSGPRTKTITCASPSSIQKEKEKVKDDLDR
jgi:hypothetical protein